MTSEDAAPRGDDARAVGPVRPEPFPGDPGHRVVCRQIVDLLADYLEGELDDSLGRDVQAHLEVCPECRTFLDQVRTTRSLLGQLPQPEQLPEELVARLVAEFRDVIPP